MKEDLYSLFKKCLDAEYIKTAHGGDIAFSLEDGALYIFFEESDGAEDWKNNLSITAEPYGDMKEKWRCHSGFLKVFKGMREHIDSAIDSAAPTRIVTVGYSHGAALALLAHEYIWYNRPEYRKSLLGYGFGCPRAVYGRIPKQVLLRWEGFLRIRHRGDIVTHLPPMIVGYRHVGKQIFIGRQGLSGVDAHRPEAYLNASKRLTL